MITTKRIAPTIAALAIVAAGCSSADIAATVNDSEITESFALSIRASNADRLTVSGEEFRNDLSRLIFTQAMMVAAEEDFGLTDMDSQEARDAYRATISPAEQGFLDSIAADPSFTEAAVDVATTQLMLRDGVRRALGQDQEIAEEIWQNDQESLVQVCASHILVQTEEEANVVFTRLTAGEDFAAVAQEVSLDTQSPGGALPCPASPAEFVGSFGTAVAAAPVGEPTGPVQTEFGYHIILVDSNESPASLDEMMSDPVAWIPADILDSYWNMWLNEVVERAEISVRSDIGMWYPPVDGIIPPPSSP
ncbi:MAG: peptidylprolyl isomerase [Actinomycetota bacterium]